VQAVLGLVPDGGALAVEHLDGDLLSRVGGEAVQDDGAVLGSREQIGVDPEGGQIGATAIRRLLVAHADPDVGVDRVGGRGRVARVAGQLRFMTLLQLVAGRRRDDHLDPGQLAGNRQRTGDVVAVADVGEAEAGEIATALAQGEQVGKGLAGMVERGERVDDGHLGRGGELGHRLVGAGADHDRVDVAREHPRRVANRLATRELQFVAAQDQRRRAELGDADLEGDPGPGRGLLEDEGDAAAHESLPAKALTPTGFQRGGAVEQLAELEGAELFSGEEVSLLQAADTTAVEFTAVGWNLFHGRDFPPDPALFTWRSRLLRITERNETHVQVNRELVDEFAGILAAAEWDVALLQECPPRFAAPLAEACDAEAHRVLTSRNSLGALRTFAARHNPDLIASGEGGSNLTLVRSPFRCALSPYKEGKAHRNGGIVERRELEIHEGRPERRAMAFTRIDVGADAQLCVANLHATNDLPTLATADVLRAAQMATEWAGDAPLLFGGDLNLRPGENPSVFEELREGFGLAGATGSNAIDHLLSRGLEAVEPPAAWPAERRELPDGDRALRLSDHAPIAASFATPATG